jgi:RimJ/RimL family protein N-acetyltransferase
MFPHSHITDEDIATIKRWPPYPAEFQDLDYAIRDGGWLDEYSHEPGAEILIADDDGEIAGFTVIVSEPGGIAEFRIAVHPEKLGRGTGKTIMLLTLAHGFSDPATRTIRLIVRKNNPQAKNLYEHLHFRHTGECTEVIQGKPVEFFRMEIDRATYQKENHQ